MIEMQNPMRVLHVTEMLSAAGIESFFMNVYRKIDRTKVQFDFLVLRNEHEFYDEEIKKLGGKKYCISSTKSNTMLRILEESDMINDFLQEHPYEIVHIHYTTPLRAPYLKALKKSGVKARIYHSHSAYVSGKSVFKHIIYGYMKTVITKYATDYFACSKAAGEWVFEKKLLIDDKVKVIHNGLEIDRFKYNEHIRNEVRNELGVGDSFVIINTGRFTAQKNQIFLVEVFNKLQRVCCDSRLLLLGDGPLKETVIKRVKELAISDKVIFLGVKNNVQDYLFASDCYVMPSLYEGLPVAGVEAQCAGLPCVFSENITKEVELTNNISFISLEASYDTWCNQIVSYRGYRNFNAHNEVKDSGYDMLEVAHTLQSFYMNKLIDKKD